jgi:hypothetical protein
MNTKPQGVLWVCTDCMLAREHGELPPDDFRCCNGTYEPWLLEPTTEVTMGLGWEKHAEDCSIHLGVTQGEHRRYDCDRDCEHDNFGTHSCDGCGHPCYGDRYAYTWWA